MSERKVSESPILIDDLGQLVPPDFKKENFPKDEKLPTKSPKVRKIREITSRTLQEFREST